jgi:hypothetical protein
MLFIYDKLVQLLYLIDLIDFFPCDKVKDCNPEIAYSLQQMS